MQYHWGCLITLLTYEVWCHDCKAYNLNEKREVDPPILVDKWRIRLKSFAMQIESSRICQKSSTAARHFGRLLDEITRKLNCAICHMDPLVCYYQNNSMRHKSLSLPRYTYRWSATIRARHEVALSYFVRNLKSRTPMKKREKKKQWDFFKDTSPCSHLLTCGSPKHISSATHFQSSVRCNTRIGRVTIIVQRRVSGSYDTYRVGSPWRGIACGYDRQFKSPQYQVRTGDVSKTRGLFGRTYPFPFLVQVWYRARDKPR